MSVEEFKIKIPEWTNSELEEAADAILEEAKKRKPKDES